MKLIFASTYHYPALPAQFKHGLLMARNYAAILEKDFLYIVNFSKDETLHGVQYRAMDPIIRLRRYRLLTAYAFIYLGVFFTLHASWRGRETVVVTQESKLALLLLFWKVFFGFRVIYECHGLHSMLTDWFVCRNANAVIFVTRKTQEEAMRKYGALRKSVLLPNAADTTDFNEALLRDRAELRRSLELPVDAYIVGYVGRYKAVGYDKGIETALRALARVSDSTILFCFVGGSAAEINEFKEKAHSLGVADRAIFVPFQKDARKVAQYTVAMDILMYAPPPVKFFMEETSPMKLYEYMAAERPIVVSDFPALREILDDESAFFFDPHEPDALLRAIERARGAPQEAKQRARSARARVVSNTWRARAERILDVAHTLV